MSIKVINTEKGTYVSWQAVAGAERYKIQLSPRSDFQRVVAEYGTGAELEYFLGKLDNASVIHIRVLACISYIEREVGCAVLESPVPAIGNVIAATIVE